MAKERSKYQARCDLNVLKNYEEIVMNFTSPTLVLAGPGAGKTYMLADRVNRLLQKGVRKEEITVLTFGKDARQHMYKKLVDPTGDFKIEPQGVPNISTMHSLGLGIVQKKARKVDLRKTGLRVQDDEDVKRLLYRDAALILGLTEEDSNDARLCKQYGDCQEVADSKRCKICRKYWSIMSKCNCLDFDDQILFACRIFENDPDVLGGCQGQAKHLLVDEYQDINAAQFKLIEMLSRPNRNGLFTVGDDAQTIYAFRGSDTKFILNFGQDYPGASTPPLAHSRRCHERILSDAIKVLEAYYPQWTGKQELQFHVPCGEEPAIWQLPSEVAEAEMLAKVAQHHIKEKKSVLILAPKKGFFPLISRKLTAYNVPHDCPVNLLSESVNKRISVVKRLIDWVSNPSDSFTARLAFEDLINTGATKAPGADKSRRCRPETIEKRIAEETEIARLWESVDRNNDLFSVLRRLAKPNVTLARMRSCLLELLESHAKFTTDGKGEFLKQLAVVSAVWVDPSNFVNDLSAIVDLLDSQRPTGSSCAQLMTMRKAKGLEADVVFMVGLEDDITPGSNKDLAEEARLFYVSMTRAKDLLYLFHAYKRPRNISYGTDLMDKPRSRFLDAIGRKSEWKTVQ